MASAKSYTTSKYKGKMAKYEDICNFKTIKVIIDLLSGWQA